MRNPFLTLIFEHLHGDPLKSKMASYNVHIKRLIFNEIQKGQNHEKYNFSMAVRDKQSIYFTTIPQSPWQQPQGKLYLFKICMTSRIVWHAFPYNLVIF